MTELNSELSSHLKSDIDRTINDPSNQGSEGEPQETRGSQASLDTSSLPWHTVPHQYRIRCGLGYASNNKHTSTCGIYLSTVGTGSKSDLISLFYIDKMRRYPGDPALFDVELHNPQTGERIGVAQAGARDIAQTIHLRSGSPHAPLTWAIYTLLSGMCMDMEREREDTIKE